MFEGLWGFIVDHPFITATIFAALAFDFVNGFHDSANAIATVVATKVLTPLQAVIMAGFFNFIGPFVLGTAVAATVGKGIIHSTKIDPAILPGIVFAALVGAIVWDLITWYVGLPTSSSHALVGGLIGAGLAAVGPSSVVLPTWEEALGVSEFAILGALGGGLGAFVAFGLSRVKLPRPLMAPMGFAGAIGFGVLYWSNHSFPGWADVKGVLEYLMPMFAIVFLGTVAGIVLWAATQQPMSLRLLGGFAVFGACLALVVVTLTGTVPMGGVTKTLVFMVVSPVLGFFSGFLLASAVAWVVRKQDPAIVSSGSKRAQLFSSAFYALTHGTNDAQKTMGIILVLLIAAGAASGTGDFDIPTWVIIASAGAMGVGTLFGGWRIVQTMAGRITHLTPAQGFAAETGGGVVLVGMAQAGIPVSTTHAISSSIMGVGATKRTSAVRWGVGRRIVGAWVLTIPASAIVAFATYWLYALIV
jgi:PiT family inorganic phosphate transporter